MRTVAALHEFIRSMIGSRRKIAQTPCHRMGLGPPCQRLDPSSAAWHCLQGSRFDEQGRMKQWWDSSVVSAYDSKKTCFEDVYSTYVIEGDHVNGNLTIG